MPGRIRTHRDGPIATLVFDHPERRNAVTHAMWAALADALDALRTDSSVRCVVMRGEGDHAFVSGADISELQPGTTFDIAPVRAMLALAAFDKPLLAMIHGYCMGAGLAIALAADMRIASENARFSIPAAKLGIGYPLEGVAELAALVGMSAAKDILYTGRKVEAVEALRMGLVNAVRPQSTLAEHVGELAGTIASNAPLTIAAVKRCAIELSRPEWQRDYAGASAAIGACFASADFGEGLSAFLEKRRPSFTGT